jgi:hypothetical protein
VRKISPPPGFDPLTVQPVTIRYTYGRDSHKSDDDDDDDDGNNNSNYRPNHSTGYGYIN